MKEFSHRKACMIGLLIMSFMLYACAPTYYKKPIKDFQESTHGAKEIYLSQLKCTHESFLMHHEVIIKIDVLTTKDIKYQYDEPSFYSEEIKKIEDLKLTTEEGIPSKSLKIRKEAFKVLEYYGETLQTLASNEKTDALKTELSGLSKDLKTLVETTETLTDAHDAFAFLKPASDWIGPLKSAIGVINSLTNLVSNHLRKEAIREAIIKSDSGIQQLLEILKNEAIDAAYFQKTNYDGLIKQCDDAKTKQFSGIAEEFLIYDSCFDVLMKSKQHLSIDELTDVFKLVSESHTEMRKMAEGGNYAEIVRKIRSFTERIQDIREKLATFMNN